MGDVPLPLTMLQLNSTPRCSTTARVVLVALIATCVLLVAMLTGPPLPPASKASSHVPAFPIDMVITWVDGSDAAWANSFREEAVRMGLAPDVARMPAAPRNGRDDLYYNLQGLIRHLPWLRTVYLVTQRPQIPVYLDALRAEASFPIRVVHHDMYMPAAALPSFNSNAIELLIHQIPGLSEHFLYANDDTVVLKPLRPGHFFSSSGQCFSPVQTSMPHRLCRSTRAQFKCQLDQTRSALCEAGYERCCRGRFYGRVHGVHALTRTMLEDTRLLLGEHGNRTLYNRHRTSTCVIPIWAAVNVKHQDTVLTSGPSYRFKFVRELTWFNLKELPALDMVCMNNLNPDHPDWVRKVYDAYEQLLGLNVTVQA